MREPVEGGRKGGGARQRGRAPAGEGRGNSGGARKRRFRARPPLHLPPPVSAHPLPFTVLAQPPSPSTALFSQRRRSRPLYFAVPSPSPVGTPSRFCPPNPHSLPFARLPCSLFPLSSVCVSPPFAHPTAPFAWQEHSRASAFTPPVSPLPGFRATLLRARPPLLWCTPTALFARKGHSGGGRRRRRAEAPVSARPLSPPPSPPLPLRTSPLFPPLLVSTCPVVCPTPPTASFA